MKKVSMFDIAAGGYAYAFPEETFAQGATVSGWESCAWVPPAHNLHADLFVFISVPF